MAAEQDRYGNAFSLPKSTINNAKGHLQSLTNDAKNLTAGAEQEVYHSHWSMGGDYFNRLASKQGLGAEQDRYASHFGLGETVSEKMVDALKDDHLLKNAWLGHDGKSRLAQLAMKQGVGAEQDRYGKGFGVEKSTLNKAKNEIERGWEKVTR